MLVLAGVVSSLELAYAKDNDNARVKAVKRPSHVVVMVFDQMRPDYIDKFNLPNFKRVRSSGVNFSEALVGHLPSITIVSHPVLATGLMPRELPWLDHLLVERGRDGKGFEVEELSGASPARLLELMKEIPNERFLASEIKKHLGGEVFAVGTKQYAATTFGGAAADGIITLAIDGDRCRPDGKDVPKYISKNQRFSVPCGGGVDPLIAPFGAARHVPGGDLEHQGGDVWVADVAQEIMAHEEWRGLLLTFSGIDKAGHLLGVPDSKRKFEGKVRYTLEEIIRIADAQLGRILTELEQHKILDSTLIVITADHGGQTDEFPLGEGSSGFARGKSDPTKLRSTVKELAQVRGVVAVAADTGVRVWLDGSESSRTAARKILQESPKVFEVFELQGSEDRGFGYVRVAHFPAAASSSQQLWAKRTNPRLLSSLANPGSPNLKLPPSLVASLSDDAGYGQLGDHGGAQELVQRIPIILRGPGLPGGVEDPRSFGLKDLHDEIVRVVGGE